MTHQTMPVKRQREREYRQYITVLFIIQKDTNNIKNNNKNDKIEKEKLQ